MRNTIRILNKSQPPDCFLGWIVITFPYNRKTAVGVRKSNSFLVKRETGESPVRTRHCKQKECGAWYRSEHVRQSGMSGIYSGDCIRGRIIPQSLETGRLFSHL